MLLHKIHAFLFLLFLYLGNYLINKIPFYFVRHLYYRKVIGIGLGKGSSIHMNCFLYGNKIQIASDTTINRRCFIDGRGGVSIGNHVCISPEVFILTDDHILNSKKFEGRSREVVIDDYGWIGARAIILPSIHVGVGAVVASGAVVTKDIPPYSVVAGVPATIISQRTKELDYKVSWTPFFD